MTTDPLEPVQSALASGRPAIAVDLAWKAVRPAVLAQDTVLLARCVHLAEEIALASDGDVRLEAEQLAAYCSACLAEPREAIPSSWSMKGMFRRRTPDRRKCPECAEDIAVAARVCRFCGYRISPPA